MLNRQSVQVAWREIALVPGEQSVRHCFEHDVASGCAILNAVKHSVAEVEP